MFVHGTSAQVEWPERIFQLTRRGYGTMAFQPDARGDRGFNWFHFAVPTPVQFEDTRPVLTAVWLGFNASAAHIRNVHVYDGSDQIAAFDLDIDDRRRPTNSQTGDHRGVGDQAGEFLMSPAPGVPVTRGVGLTVGVQFLGNVPPGATGEAIQSFVEFTYAGGVFEDGR